MMNIIVTVSRSTLWPWTLSINNMYTIHMDTIFNVMILVLDFFGFLDFGDFWGWQNLKLWLEVKSKEILK